MTLGRPRWGRLSLTQVEITLARLKLFLLPDVLSYSLLVKANRTHTVPLRPKMQARHTTFFQQFSVDAYRTLPFQENRSCEIRCTWEGCSYTGGCGPVARCLLSVLLLSAHKALEEFAPRDAEGPI